jgi:hypothetical protein
MVVEETQINNSEELIDESKTTPTPRLSDKKATSPPTNSMNPRKAFCARLGSRSRYVPR